MSPRFAPLLLTLLLAPSALAQVQVPAVPAPPPSAAPSMWFGPSEVAGLKQRRQDPLVAAHYARVKSLVDGRASANFANLSDDLLSRIAKGAALLEQMGETRSGASYRDLARDAILAVDDRTPPNIFGQGGNLQTQYDCGRLQSLAEARDMLLGTGLSGADLAAIDRKLANWADAFTRDRSLGFRNNNLGIKAGCALVSVGLALSGDTRAGGWIGSGVRLINAGLREMGSTSGYFLEGPHYLNYTLNNLAPTAYHVRNRTGVDWFGPLRPLVAGSLALRLPSGNFVPYEDAITAAFPGLYLAGGYPNDPLAGELLWAWQNGAQGTSSFGNQQLVDATAFLVGDPAIVPSRPARATSFLRGDVHLASLRNGFGPDAIQATLLTARDYSSLTLISSRHNLPNPLAIALSGLGDDLLVTGSGGPLLTRSANRAAYLPAANHCTILVDGQAPFTTDPAHATTDLRIDSESEGGLPHQFFDGARTAVHTYPNATRVRRTLGLIAGRYSVVFDEVELSQAASIALPFRGRGQGQALWTSGGLLGASWTLPAQASGTQTALDLAAATSAPATLRMQAGHYAPAWNQEETLDVARLEARASATHVITVLAPRLSSEAPLAVVERSRGGAVGLEVTTRSGALDTFAAGPAGSIRGVGSIDAADAEWVVVREVGGSLESVAVAGATSLEVGGVQVLSASAPVACAATSSPGGLVVTFSQEGAAAQVELRGLIPGARGALWNGQPLAGFQASGDRLSFPIPAGGGTLRVEAGSGGVAPVGSAGTAPVASTQAGVTSAGPTGGGGGGGGGCQQGGASGSPGAALLALVLIVCLDLRRR